MEKINYRRSKNSDEEKLKKLLIITGVHGNEVSPLYLRYILDQKHEEISKDFGTIDLLNCVNAEGIKNRTREIPSIQPTTDINRMFGNKKLKPEPLQEWLEKNIFSEPYDLVIDVHASDSIIPCIVVTTGHKKNKYIKKAYSNLLIVDNPSNHNASIKDFVNRYESKLGITLEVDGLNKFIPESIETGFQYIKSLTQSYKKYLKLVEEEVEQEDEKFINMFSIKSHYSGIVIDNRATPGRAYWDKGDLICKIYNPLEGTINKVFSPFTGYNLFYLKNSGWVNAGDELIVLGVQN